MKVLDLFCGGGGAAWGLHLAWPDADITGVDLAVQKNYPFRFVQGDALTVDLAGYDFVWASPLCQRWSLGTARWDPLAYADLIAPIRARLQAWGGPWVMENVERAPLVRAVMLCGEMFGLRVIRHRVFESNYLLLQPPHPRHRERGLTPTGYYCTVAGHGGDGRNHYATWARAMGIDWMTKEELTEAIPPAYSEYLARQLTPLFTARAA